MQTLELEASLRSADMGEMRGIGARYVQLPLQGVELPAGVEAPARDKGRGIVGRILGEAAEETASKETKRLLSQQGQGRVLDERLLGQFLIARDYGLSGFRGEAFLPAAEASVRQAVSATNTVSEMALFGAAKRNATDWRSLFEGFLKASVFGKDFQPTIITSAGGYEGPATIAAPFNIVPAFELAANLSALGYEPEVIAASASDYAVSCNNAEKTAADANWEQTKKAYRSVLAKFYPGLTANVSFEILDPEELKDYPDFIGESARAISETNQSLRATANRYGSEEDAYIAYMLSHIQAFRDYQPGSRNRFVIKVGAASEMRFSAWQRAVIENCLDDAVDSGFVPNRVVVPAASYGQVSLFYPRLGKRPVYYPDGAGEPELGSFEAQAENYDYFLDGLDDGLKDRYLRLGRVLGTTAISPDDYLRLFAGEPV